MTTRRRAVGKPKARPRKDDIALKSRSKPHAGSEIKTPNPGLLERITERRLAVGLTETAADRAAGLPIGTIRNLRRSVERGIGRGGMLHRTISALAPVLKTTVAYLQDGKEPSYSNPNAAEIVIEATPVLGEIVEGVWRDHSLFGDQLEPRGMLPVVRDQRFPHARQYALLVTGDAADIDFPDNSYVMCVDFSESGLAIHEGLIIHIERRRGDLVETILRRVEMQDGQLALMPRSRNSAYKSYSIPKLKSLESTGVLSDGTEFIVRGAVIGKYESMAV